MLLEHTFSVPVPVDRAWRVLLDLPLVVPCMPGATLTGVDGDAFTGTVKVKLGPITLTYRGRGRFVERDEAARRVVVEAQGKDIRAAGTATAAVTAVLAGSGDHTVVTVTTDLTVTGRPAQFGRNMIAEVSGKLLDQFAGRLADTLGATQPTGPTPAGGTATANADGARASAATAGGTANADGAGASAATARGTGSTRANGATTDNTAEIAPLHLVTSPPGTPGGQPFRPANTGHPFRARTAGGGPPGRSVRKPRRLAVPPDGVPPASLNSAAVPRRPAVARRPPTRAPLRTPKPDVPAPVTPIGTGMATDRVEPVDLLRLTAHTATARRIGWLAAGTLAAVALGLVVARHRHR